jgi:hypothetical protein
MVRAAMLIRFQPLIATTSRVRSTSASSSNAARAR